MSDEATQVPGGSERRRITPIDVQQQVFRRAMLRGYNEQEVDDFLDEITEEVTALLEEQRRLREQLQAGVTQPVMGSGDVAEASRMAEEIVRRANEEAAEILRKARTEAAASSPGGRSMLQPFLAQERVFLQDLSKLIQGHADTVRDMARARRPAPAPLEQATEEPAPEESPASQEPAPLDAGAAEEPIQVPEPSPEPGEPEASLKEPAWGEE